MGGMSLAMFCARLTPDRMQSLTRGIKKDRANEVRCGQGMAKPNVRCGQGMAKPNVRCGQGMAKPNVSCHSNELICTPLSCLRMPRLLAAEKQRGRAKVTHLPRCRVDPTHCRVDPTSCRVDPTSCRPNSLSNQLAVDPTSCARNLCTHAMRTSTHYTQ